MIFSKKLYTGLLLIAILFSGCARDNGLQAAAESTPATLPVMNTERPTFPEETQEPTELPTELPQLLDVQPGAHQLRYESDDGNNYMEYYLYVPQSPQLNMPIIVFLHGAGEIGRVDLLKNYGIASVVNEIYGDEFPFLLLLPCTHMSSWNYNHVTRTLIDLIDSVAETYKADRSRICITGHSLGSSGTWKMVSLYSDYFSAAVPVSYGIDESIDIESCTKVPIIAFAGTSGDAEKQYNAAMHNLVAKINEAGGSAQIRIIEGADHEAMVTAAYTKELFDWLLSQ